MPAFKCKRQRILMYKNEYFKIIKEMKKIDDLQVRKSYLMHYIQIHPLMLKFLARKYKRDREIVLTAVMIDGDALEYASKKLRNDKEIVLEAVRYRGIALKYASVTLRNDDEIVLTAVSFDCRALQYASNRLKDNENIILAAILENNLMKICYDDDRCNHCSPLQYASRNIKKNLNILSICYRRFYFLYNK